MLLVASSIQVRALQAMPELCLAVCMRMSTELLHTWTPEHRAFDASAGRVLETVCAGFDAAVRRVAVAAPRRLLPL